MEPIAGLAICKGALAIFGGIIILAGIDTSLIFLAPVFNGIKKKALRNRKW